MQKNKKIKEGSLVTLDFKGTFDDGTIFDSTFPEDVKKLGLPKERAKPLKFRVGEKRILPSFEKNIKGMKESESKSFRISAKDAFGDYDKNKIREVPIEVFGDKEPIKDHIVVLTATTGEKIFATVKDIEGDKVVLDLNHPLAGKDLNYFVKIRKVE